MGKKKKKSLYKKMMKGNKVLIAALTGVAAGVTLTSILGTEKAKQILNTVEDSIGSFASKMADSASDNGIVSSTSKRADRPVANS